ncbi:hypothetical protein D3C80_1267730 [compost metagenome]
MTDTLVLSEDIRYLNICDVLGNVMSLFGIVGVVVLPYLLNFKLRMQCPLTECFNSCPFGSCPIACRDVRATFRHSRSRFDCRDANRQVVFALDGMHKRAV